MNVYPCPEPVIRTNLPLAVTINKKLNTTSHANLMTPHQNNATVAAASSSHSLVTFPTSPAPAAVASSFSCSFSSSSPSSIAQSSVAPSRLVPSRSVTVPSSLSAAAPEWIPTTQTKAMGMGMGIGMGANAVGTHRGTGTGTGIGVGVGSAIGSVVGMGVGTKSVLSGSGQIFAVPLPGAYRVTEINFVHHGDPERYEQQQGGHRAVSAAVQIQNTDQLINNMNALTLQCESQDSTDNSMNINRSSSDSSSSAHHQMN